MRRSFARSRTKRLCVLESLAIGELSVSDLSTRVAPGANMSQHWPCFAERDPDEPTRVPSPTAPPTTGSSRPTDLTSGHRPLAGTVCELALDPRE
jgi:hypothetical protein